MPESADGSMRAAKRARDEPAPSGGGAHSSSTAPLDFLLSRRPATASSASADEEPAEVHGGPAVEFEGGEEFVGFNMDNELEEDGHFDAETGGFVWARRERAMARRAGLRAGQ